jgi:hypothetical protein
MFWLRFAQWVMWAHLILLGSLTVGAVVGLCAYGVFLFLVRGLP